MAHAPAIILVVLNLPSGSCTEGQEGTGGYCFSCDARLALSSVYFYRAEW